MLRLDAMRFGLSGGIFLALVCFFLTLIAAASGFGLGALNVLKSIFIGYEISVFGSLLGAFYSFMTGFVSLFLIAFVYNLLGPAKDRNGR